MARLKLLVYLEYNAELTHGDDQEATEWFLNDILLANPGDDTGLFLYSGELGDEIGRITVVRIVETETPRGR